jgi:hypothetical protein
MDTLTERYKDKISGVIGCYDRIVLKGTLPKLCYAGGMTDFMKKSGVKIFEYAKFVEPFREKIRQNAETLATKNNLNIEFVRNTNARKEDIVKKHFDGNKTGLVYILSAMEACPSYLPWHDKINHKTALKSTQGKCLHYYFYFNDPDIGFGYVRVPTWCPFQLQVYFNGHNLLANDLKKNGIHHTMLDNAFDYIADFKLAQQLSDNLDVNKLFKKLEWFSDLYCPVYKEFQINDQPISYHWSIMQQEYATDIVFKKQDDLKDIYEELVKVAIHTVKPTNIATFLSQKLHGNYEGEIGNNYNIRIEGSRIKHSMGEVSIKMYDKFSKILRIETTVNNVSFFKHYRTVEHRDGTTSQKMASVKKNIFSLTALIDIMKASNSRYLTFISAIEDNSIGKKKLQKITTSKTENKRTYKGLNFFQKEDQDLLIHLTSGEFTINGFRAKHIQKRFEQYSSSKISRILKRLRKLGIIKKGPKCYKYYITKTGLEAITTALKLKNLVIIPQLNTQIAA